MNNKKEKKVQVRVENSSVNNVFPENLMKVRISDLCIRFVVVKETKNTMEQGESTIANSYAQASECTK